MWLRLAARRGAIIHKIPVNISRALFNYVHISQDIGQITGLETKELPSIKRVFYMMRTGTVQYWSPVSETELGRVRPIKSPELFIEALAVLSEFHRNFSSL